MAKVTFILGLCGSGKTYLSQKLKEQTGADVFENLFENGSSLSALIQCLKEGKDCIIDEVRLCLPTYQNAIMQHLSQIAGLEAHWICYENDLESANWNVIHRKNKGDPEGHLEINLRLHPHYNHPANAAIIPIQRI